MLGGRPLQNLAAALHAMPAPGPSTAGFRAPGMTQVSLSRSHAQAGSAGGLKGALDVNSSDPDALTAWLQGAVRSPFNSQKPLHLHGDVSIAGRSGLRSMRCRPRSTAAPSRGGSRSQRHPQKAVRGSMRS